MVEAYCVKCKKKGQKMESPEIVKHQGVDIWLKVNAPIVEQRCVL